jgi:hypothetical protein
MTDGKTDGSGSVRFKTHSDKYIGVQSPTGLGLEATARALNSFVEGQRELVRTHILLPGVYWEDALLAYWATIQEICGVPVVAPRTDKISIEVRDLDGNVKTTQVPLGKVTCKIQSQEDGATYDVVLQTGINSENECEEPGVSVAVLAPGLLGEIVEYFERSLKHNIATGRYSKIKGKVVSMTFPYRRGSECFSIVRHTAKYEVASMKIEDLVFNDNTARRIETQILQRIRRREEITSMGVPFNSTHLLVGAYGTGKTALISALLNEATQAGFTCVFVRDARDLEFGNEWIRQYEPAILIVEDVNRLLESEDDSRTVQQDNLTNLMDGISSKSRNLLTLFTVNDVDKILPVFLRPGRMTSLIEMEDLNPEAALRLLRKVANLTGADGEWIKILQGFGPVNPSTIAGIGQAATLLAALEGKSTVEFTDVEEAFASMHLQLRLVNRAKREDLTTLEKAAKILAAGVVSGRSEDVSSAAALLSSY